MVEYRFSELAYAKMIFHAAKYPQLGVNGILLARKSSKTDSVHIVDAVPLFHQCLYVTPMVEIALMQIDALAARDNLIVAGYYAAPEDFYDSSVERAPAAKIADKIQEVFLNACFVLIDNKLLSLVQKKPALKVFYYHNDRIRWTKTIFTLVQPGNTLEAVSELLQRGAMKDIVDFDNHLDNPENDWTNNFVNMDLQKLLAMY